MEKAPKESKAVCYEFDDVFVDSANFRVQKGGAIRALTPRAFDVLVFLIEHHGRVVEKKELFEQVWKESFVTDNALTRIVKEIRQIIGDDAEAPRYIETAPKRGYRFIADVKRMENGARREDELENAVEALIEAPTVGATPESVSASRRGSGLGRTGLVGVLVLVLAAVGGFVVWKTQTRSAEQPPAVLRNVQITTWPGLDLFPALSPDGNSVAYSSDHSGSFEIYVSPLTPGAREIQITADGQQNFEPAWSPDGKLIAYYSKDRGGIWMVPASGGAPKQLTEFGSRPAWSPDGAMIAFQSYGLLDIGATSVGALTPSTLWVVQAGGGDPTPLTQAGDPPGGHGAPSWSPDAKRIVFIAYDGTLATMWTLSVQSKLKRITDRRTWAYDPIYSPDGEHIYFGGVSDSGSFVLYQLRVSPSSGEAAGEPMEVAQTGLARIKNLSISADGRRIAYAGPTMMGKLELIALSPGSGEAAPPVSLTQNTTYRKAVPIFSPDGSKIAYTEFRGGTNQDIWVMDSDGKNQLQLTTHSAVNWAPSWFPDGDRIAFQSFRGGKQLILSISSRSRRENLLLDPGQSIGWPRLSPDGSQVAFNSTKSGTINVWIAGLGGGEPRQLTFDSDTMGWPCWSPDGKFIAFQMKRGENTHVMLMSPDGNSATQLTFESGQSWPYSWSPDGDKIAFAGQRNDIWNVYCVSRASREQRQLTHYSRLNAYVRYPAYSPVGNQIVYEHSETTGNIWMLELK